MMLAYWDGETVRTIDRDTFDGSLKGVTSLASSLVYDMNIYVTDDELALKWLYHMMANGVPVAESPSTRMALTVLMGVNRVLYHVSYRNAAGRRLRICRFANLVRADPRGVMDMADCGDYGEAVLSILHECNELGIWGLTIGSEAMRHYRESLGVRRFARVFPEIDAKAEHMLRTAYTGGYLYCMPGDYGRTTDYDNNSMYAAQMRDEYLPYGEAVPYSGRYEKDGRHPLHVDVMTFRADLKEGGNPWLTIPHTAIDFEGARVESTHGYITMALSDVDQQNLYDNYDVSLYEVQGGWKFQRSKAFFGEWVDTWGAVKEHDKGIRKVLGKTMLTSLVGKFGSVPRGVGLSPHVDGDALSWSPVRTRVASMNRYVPVSIYVNAYARRELMAALDANRDRVVYANTDGFILTGEEPAKGIEVDPVEIGKWKREHEWGRLRILRLGLYQGERLEGGDDIISSGISLSDPVSWSSFHEGGRVSDDYGTEVVL